RLLEVPGAGHSMLDTRSQITQVAARWSACGAAHLLPEHAHELAALPATPTDQALSRGLQLALAAERYSPWRIRVESARAKREQAQVDPRSRRTRHVKLD
ncbi:MAG: alpha/beta fold hydrolase, partial [Brachybacterium tyrofermentans]